MRHRGHLGKLIVVTFLVTAILFCLAANVGSTGHSDLSCGLLPDIGSLDTLPSGPGLWLTAAASIAAKAGPLLAVLPPRGPPA